MLKKGFKRVISIETSSSEECMEVKERLRNQLMNKQDFMDGNIFLSHSGNTVNLYFLVGCADIPVVII